MQKLNDKKLTLLEKIIIWTEKQEKKPATTQAISKKSIKDDTNNTITP